MIPRVHTVQCYFLQWYLVRIQRSNLDILKQIVISRSDSLFLLLRTLLLQFGDAANRYPLHEIDRLCSIEILLPIFLDCLNTFLFKTRSNSQITSIEARHADFVEIIVWDGREWYQGRELGVLLLLLGLLGTHFIIHCRRWPSDLARGRIESEARTIRMRLLTIALETLRHHELLWGRDHTYLLLDHRVTILAILCWFAFLIENRRRLLGYAVIEHGLWRPMLRWLPRLLLGQKLFEKACVHVRLFIPLLSEPAVAKFAVVIRPLMVLYFHLAPILLMRDASSFKL